MKYILLAFILLSILAGWYPKLQGMSPWDVFSMLTAQKTSECLLQDWNHSSCSDHDGNVYTGALFLSVFVSDGSSICNDADSARLHCFKRDRSKCPAKCGALQETLSGTSGY